MKTKIFNFIGDFERTTTDSEVGHYVRGVLDLFCKLMTDIQNDTIKGSD